MLFFRSFLIFYFSWLHHLRVLWEQNLFTWLVMRLNRQSQLFQRISPRFWPNYCNLLCCWYFQFSYSMILYFIIECVECDVLTVSNLADKEYAMWNRALVQSKQHDLYFLLRFYASVSDLIWHIYTYIASKAQVSDCLCKQIRIILRKYTQQNFVALMTASTDMSNLHRMPS